MSVVYQVLPRPDWAATTTVAAAGATDRNSRQWAEAIFDVDSLPPAVRALFALRQAVARALGLPAGRSAMLAVDRVVDGEAVIDTDDRHLRFAAGVSLEPGLVHVTTAVALKGWRGTVYFAPVRLLHDAITRSMMTSAVRRLSPVPDARPDTRDDTRTSAGLAGVRQSSRARDEEDSSPVRR